MRDRILVIGILAAALCVRGSAGDELEGGPCGAYPLALLYGDYPLVWTRGSREVGPANADGWRKVVRPFQETDMENGRKVEPWRYRVAMVNLREDLAEDVCEASDLVVVRDWRAEVVENVVDLCYRYYGAVEGLRGAALDRFVARLKSETRYRVDEVVAEVSADIEFMEKGRRLGLLYGQHRLACQAEVDVGGMPFGVGGH